MAARIGKAVKKACSFSASTGVLLADGTSKPISELAVGDEVLATDPETGEQAARKVTAVIVHDDQLRDLVVDGKAVTTTEGHPFWNDTDRQWQPAAALSPGDRLLGPDGSTAEVEGMRIGPVSPARAYNLTIDDIHTYYVFAGKTPVLVHNGDGDTTRLGVTRTNPQDWRDQMRIWDDDPVYKDILSRGNRWRIEHDLVPRVDRQWVGFFPGDAKLIGENITMHHIGGYKLTVLLPTSRHLDAHMPGGFRYNPGGPGSCG